MTDPHPTPHRATDENWQLIRERADRLGYASDRAICDMADTLAALERRVEALEPSQFPTPIAPIEALGPAHAPAAAPSPPTLRERALAVVEQAHQEGNYLDSSDVALIREALQEGAE